jgi:oligopeptide/dipeptide ABC transporter ATP-binding protein
MTEKPLLSVRHLTVSYGATKVVRDLSFDLQRGQRLALVGESGSGKTSVALALLGLIDAPGRVEAEAISLDGRNIAGLDDHRFAALRGNRMSLVVQDPMNALDPTKTIGHQIVDTIRRHNPKTSRAAARQQAVQLLAEVEIADPAHRLDDYSWQFSGGMLQRVVIAIALANGPDLLIADEPTTALDANTQDQILALLRRISTARGLAVLLITHNLAVVSAFCTDVLVLYDGQAMELGPTAQTFAHPIHPYTEALLATIPQPGQDRDRPLPTIPGAPPTPGTVLEGCSYAPRCHIAAGRTICRKIRPGFAIIQPDPLRQASCHFAAERLP